MTTYLVLTAIGEDKPGLVESLARIISDNSGNWLESSMSQLAGKFAGILRVSVNDNNADKLIHALENISDQLKLVIERAEADGDIELQQAVKLNLIGNDRPGIIREISHVLTSLSINVEQLSTECAPAPMSNDVLFKAKAKLRVPVDLEPEMLQQRIEQIADDLMVEIQIS